MTHYNKVSQFVYNKVGQFVVITKWDNFITKWDSFSLLQSGTDFITKWDSFCYYKVGRFYYKVGRVLQSGTILLQSGTGITKWDDYYKVGFNKGYTLDLIMTRIGDQLLTNIEIHDPMLSDHLAVSCTLKLEKPPLERVEIQYRRLSNINVESFNDAIVRHSESLSTFKTKLKTYLFKKFYE